VAGRATLLAVGALIASSGCPGDDGVPSACSSTGTTGGSASGVTTTTSGAEGTSGPGSDATGAPADDLPPAPALLSPADGATEVPIETSLCWTEVDDPEGEVVRYRVYVDEMELTEGRLGEGEVGHAGPCVGPLTFAYERTYAWRVQAFEADDPTRVSDFSETWTFTTEGDGASAAVFADDFEADLGWEVSGDATGGAWVRGNPAPASDGGMLSQPTSCLGGDSCIFTGQNVATVADDEDVAGGSTVLTSPAFDLSGAAAATVQFGRFFYKSDSDPAPGLSVELLVPDGAGGFVAHPLESLSQPTADAAENLWTPREYAACGVPMVDGARLRITATDQGAGILEAAIDSVIVRAHIDATVCGAAEGGICDPAAGAGACPGALLCCPQGAVNTGVHRCTPAVAGLDYDAPPATPADPNNGPLGCDAPDLIIDPSWIEPVFTDIFVSDNTCELGEGCVGDVGTRTLLRFSLSTPNIGARDLVLGVPANLPDLFHFSECHAHYHFDEYARYELRDAGGVVATGHKQAFCLLDTYSWAWPNTPGVFDCSNQGISRGFADIYESDLPCQWIDVTGLPSGDYTLRATLNQPRPESAQPLLNERDYTNNTVEVAVTIP
jgi:hypothetical protein